MLFQVLSQLLSGAVRCCPRCCLVLFQVLSQVLSGVVRCCQVLSGAVPAAVRCGQVLSQVLWGAVRPQVLLGVGLGQEGQGTKGRLRIQAPA